MKFRLFLLVLLSLSCATQQNTNPSNYQKDYSFKDLSGEFLLRVESGRKDKEFFFKKKLSGISDGKEYEKSIAISQLGKLKTRNGPINSLRPKISQMTVWFDKQEYFSQVKVLPRTRELEVKTRSPEKEWNGVKKYDFPNTKGLFCFFSQLVDCIRVTGFLHKSMEKASGRMNFTIIWDGYPFVNSQYKGLNEEPFTRAMFEYDSKSENLVKYNLSFNNQIMFYHIDENKVLKKRFWVAEGLSQISN